MRKLISFCFLLTVMQGKAQLSIGAEGLTITTGTSFSADGLALIPQANLTLTNHTLQRSTMPVFIGSSNYSISNVINFNGPLTFSGTIRLYYQEGELNSNVESGLKLAYQSSSIWATSIASAVNTADNYIEETVVSKTFAAVTASSFFTILPVSLVSFTAKLQQGGNVLLQWRTASENQSSHFAVERSSNGIHYQTIGTAQASNNPNGSDYSFLDIAPLIGPNYYRLHQYDRNGKNEVSGVRLIKTDKSLSLALYPNPVIDGFLLRMQTTPAKPMTYCIQNMAGQIVQTGTVISREQWFHTGSLSAGTYLIRLESGQTASFFKQ